MQIPNHILDSMDNLEESERQARKLKDIHQTNVNLFAIKLAKDMGYEWGQQVFDTFFNVRITIDQVYGKIYPNHANV